MEDQFFTERDERVRTRVINNRSYTITATDPFGFWVVKTKGSTPEVLQGSFTEASKLWAQIEAYEAARPVPPEKTILSTDGKGGKKRIPQNTVIEVD